MKGWQLLAATLLLLALPGPPAEGQGAAGSGQVELKASAGFGDDNLCRREAWVPVRVELTNHGAALSGQVRVQSLGAPRGAAPTGWHVQPLHLPEGGHQVLFFYVHLASAAGSIPVEVVSRTRVVASQEIPLHVGYGKDVTILGISTEPGSLGILSTLPKGGVLGGTAAAPGPRTPAMPPGMLPSSYRPRGDVRVLYPQPGFLPDRWVGYDGVDLVVLGSASTVRLTAEEAKALSDWVAAGGSLVVLGGPDVARLSQPPYSTLLPVSPESAQSINFPGSLARLGGTAAPAEPVTVALAAPQPAAEVLVGSQQLPLVVRGPHGAGTVLFLAFDPARSPLLAWEGLERVWQSILTLGLRPPSLAEGAITSGREDQYFPSYYGGSASSLATAAASLPGSFVPRLTTILLFLLAYIVFLVPVNYLLVRKMGRRELAWLTTPIIVALFTVAAYFLGYGSKGTGVITNNVAVFETSEGQKIGRLTNIHGVVFPRRRTYALQYDPAMAAAGEASTLGNQQFELTDSIPLHEAVAASVWSLRSFHSVGVSDLGGAITANLSVEGDRVVGTVTNNSSFPLRRCELRLGSATAPAFDLAPGHSQQVSIRLQAAGTASYQYGWTGSGRGEDRVSGQVRRALFAQGEYPGAAGPGGGPRLPSQQVAFCGDLSAALSRPSLDRKKISDSGLTAVVAFFPLKMGSAPQLAADAWVTEVWPEAGSAVQAQSSTQAARLTGSCIIQLSSPFLIPEDALLKSLTPQVTVVSGTPTVWLYEWGRDRWEQLGSLTAPMANPDRFLYRPAGLIRMRIQAPPGQNVDFVGAGVSAKLAR